MPPAQDPSYLGFSLLGMSAFFFAFVLGIWLHIDHSVWTPLMACERYFDNVAITVEYFMPEVL